MQSDPLGVEGGLNSYAYVSSSPLGLADPYGLCRVDVRFSGIGGGNSFYHAYLVTTEPSGSQSYFRGGPGGGAGPSGGASGAIGSGASGTSSGGSSGGGSCNTCNGSSPGAGKGGPIANHGPWGPITTESGIYRPGTVDWDPGSPPSFTVLNDDRPCACNSCFKKIIQAINSRGIPYNPLSTNSNATVSTALRECGFGSASPPVWAPGWGTPLLR